MRREGTRGYARNGNVKTNYYVDGNTVRRLEGEPEERRRRKEERERERRKQQNRHAAKKNQEQALRINLGYVLFCSVAIFLTCFVCVTYIQIQSDITSRMKNISKLESQVADLRADNAAALKRIELTSDLELVKTRAFNLGMNYAAADQIIYYSVEDSDYMNQYSDIPR